MDVVGDAPMVTLHDPEFVYHPFQGGRVLSPIQVRVVMNRQVGVGEVSRLAIGRKIAALESTPMLFGEVAVTLRRWFISIGHLRVA